MTKNTRGIIILAVLFFSSCAYSPIDRDRSLSSLSDSACVHDSETFRCVKYVRNYDGDTITVDIPNIHQLLGEKISVRIKGIDAPEINGKQPCEREVATKAALLVESTLKEAHQIDLVNVGRDKYFRILADVSVDQKFIKDVLLKNKLAYEYHGGSEPTVDWCSFIGR